MWLVLKRLCGFSVAAPSHQLSSVISRRCLISFCVSLVLLHLILCKTTETSLRPTHTFSEFSAPVWSVHWGETRSRISLLWLQHVGSAHQSVCVSPLTGPRTWTSCSYCALVKDDQPSRTNPPPPLLTYTKKRGLSPMFMCGKTLFMIFKLGPRLLCQSLSSQHSHVHTRCSVYLRCKDTQRHTNQIEFWMRGCVPPLVALGVMATAGWALAPISPIWGMQTVAVPMVTPDLGCYSFKTRVDKC